MGSDTPRQLCVLPCRTRRRAHSAGVDQGGPTGKVYARGARLSGSSSYIPLDTNFSSRYKDPPTWQTWRGGHRRQLPRQADACARDVVSADRAGQGCSLTRVRGSLRDAGRSTWMGREIRAEIRAAGDLTSWWRT